MPTERDPNRPAEVETNPTPQGDGRYPRELGTDGLPVRNPPGQAREDADAGRADERAMPRDRGPANG